MATSRPVFITVEQSRALIKVAERYYKTVAKESDQPKEEIEGSAIWLLESVHRHCPLDLVKLLSFDDFSFSHDLSGMYQHAEFSSGILKNHFLPRCAMPEEERSIEQGLFKGYTDVQSRLHQLANSVTTAEQCHHILKYCPSLQATVRKAVEIKLRKLTKGEISTLPTPAIIETLWAVYDANGERKSNLCYDTLAAIINAEMRNGEPYAKWKDLVAKGYRVRKAHVTVEAAR